MQRLPPITHKRFRLSRVRSPLLTGSLLLSSRPATEMFQFTGCPPHDLWIQSWVTALFAPPGYPIRKSPDQSLIAAPRGVSSLTTSFFGPSSQGIHRAPFVALKTRPTTRRSVCGRISSPILSTTSCGRSGRYDTQGSIQKRASAHLSMRSRHDSTRQAAQNHADTGRARRLTTLPLPQVHSTNSACTCTSSSTGQRPVNEYSRRKRDKATAPATCIRRGKTTYRHRLTTRPERFFSIFSFYTSMNLSR